MFDKLKEELNRSLIAEDFLRRFFLQDINQESLKEFLDLGKKISLELKNHEFISILRKSFEENLADELRWEFNSLFVGPAKPKALPYESTYFDYKNMFGKKTFEVREFYKNVGLQIESKQFDRFPDDYIGFELQYLYYMSFLALKNIESQEKLLEILKEKNDFIIYHPSKWFDKFALACKEGTKMEFYKAFADFLLLYLKKEEENLNSAILKFKEKKDK